MSQEAFCTVEKWLATSGAGSWRLRYRAVYFSRLNASEYYIVNIL